MIRIIFIVVYTSSSRCRNRIVHRASVVQVVVQEGLYADSRKSSQRLFIFFVLPLRNEEKK